MAKILITEDERIIAEDLKLTLMNYGHNVQAIVTSGEDAIKKAGELKPDIILMDIDLNGFLSGIEAADHIRKKYNIPVVFCTAYSDEDTMSRAFAVCPSGFITKPFEDNELKSIIDDIMGEKKPKKKFKIIDFWNVALVSAKA